MQLADRVLPGLRTHVVGLNMMAAKKRKEKRRLLIGGIVAASLVVVALLLRHPASPIAILAPTQTSPEKTLNAFLTAISNRDWANVYALSPDRERQANGWTLQQFVTFASGCAEHLPQRIGTPAIEEADPRPTPELTRIPPGATGRVNLEPLFDIRYERVYYVSFPEYGYVRRPTGDRMPKMRVSLRRGADGLWWVDCANPILTLTNLKDEPTETKCMRIVRALRRAGLRHVVFYDLHQALTADRLERFVRGEIEKAEIFEAVKGS